MARARAFLPARAELALLALILVAGAALTAHEQWLWRLDLAIYDAALSLARPRPPQDVVIVAVDEASVAQMGRWPWSRRVHAALLDRLTRDDVKAVGLDLILAEPDQVDAEADRILATAVRRNGRTVLPVLMENDERGAPSETRPLPALAAAAAALGHVHLELDRDGINRSAFLREGLNTARHSHFAVELLRVAGQPLTQWPGARSPIARSDGWLRDHWVHFPFAGAPGTFTQVSYADAVGDRLPDGFFRERIVLIGATAAGLADVYPTPVSGQGIPMPGVEVSANLLAALRSGNTLAPASPTMQLWLAPVPVLLLLLAYGALSARRALAITVGGLVLFAVAVLAALHWQRVWFPPAATALFMLTAYPLWSWRRLESAQRHLDGELARFREEPGLVPAAYEAGLVAPLEERMAAVRSAATQVREMRRLLAQTLDGLPEAALFTNAEGQVILANRKAGQYLALTAGEPLTGCALTSVLARLTPPVPPDDSPHWEAIGPGGRALLVCRAPLTTVEGAAAGSIVSLVDVSALKAAQYRRDELLSYLSHDLRSPLASILALLDTHGDGPADRAVLTSIGQLARRTVALAGDLVELSRAEAKEPAHFVEVDLAQVAHDAADEIWPQAEGKKIRVERALDTEAFVRGDPHLLRRALTNLLINAVKYSPEGTRVHIGIERVAADWRVSIADEGYGIAPENLPHVFEAHQRFRRPGQPLIEGSGLGLAFVRTVAEKHGGRARVASTSERGSCFELCIPALERTP
jgi:CHASE2 domain-containing sensor protein/signal transduction histidine kinase